MLRDSAELLAPAVADTLAAIPGKPEDAAARKLAMEYARVIDSQDGHCTGCDSGECKRAGGSAWAMRWIAPLLLDTLEALGATPAARARTAKGGTPADAPPSRVAQLRAARRA